MSDGQQVKVKRDDSAATNLKKPRGPLNASGKPICISIPRILPTYEHHSGSSRSPPAESDLGHENSLSMRCNFVNSANKHSGIDLVGIEGGGLSQSAVREYIEERYHSTALPRPLTNMDIDALLELAGFPQVPPSRVSFFVMFYERVPNALARTACSLWSLRCLFCPTRTCRGHARVSFSCFAVDTPNLAAVVCSWAERVGSHTSARSSLTTSRQAGIKCATCCSNCGAAGSPTTRMSSVASTLITAVLCVP
jgi:hypothetical protein